MKLKRFAGKLTVVPPTPHAPHPTTDGDAVGTLLDICVQRELPLPKYVNQPIKPFIFASPLISMLSCDDVNIFVCVSQYVDSQNCKRVVNRIGLYSR